MSGNEIPIPFLVDHTLAKHPVDGAAHVYGLLDIVYCVQIHFKMLLGSIYAWSKSDYLCRLSFFEAIFHDIDEK